GRRIGRGVVGGVVADLGHHVVVVDVGRLVLVVRRVGGQARGQRRDRHGKGGGLVRFHYALLVFTVDGTSSRPAMDGDFQPVPRCISGTRDLVELHHASEPLHRGRGDFRLPQ